MTLAKRNYGYLRRPDDGAHGDLDSAAHWFLSWAPVDGQALLQVSVFREVVRIDCQGQDTPAMEWFARGRNLLWAEPVRKSPCFSEGKEVTKQGPKLAVGGQPTAQETRFDHNTLQCLASPQPTDNTDADAAQQDRAGSGCHRARNCYFDKLNRVVVDCKGG
jgi:hypothetical protein